MGERLELNFREPRFFLVFLTILIAAVILFYFVASMITSVGYQTFAEAGKIQSNSVNTVTVILDAGHGGEDPGAIANGVTEKEINLAVAKKIAVFLKLSGYNVLLTRENDRLLYNDGEEARKKFFDLYNRVKIAAGETNAVFVSIHMNKFPLESCKGLQTFYSKKHPSNQAFANTIQESNRLLNVENKRQSKEDPGTIYVLKSLEIPSVLVECGFLSNQEEAKMLSENGYQEDLAFTIYCGIIKFLQENQIENQLYLQ